ncbi:MAG TPA: lecithin retinol acyltransferase family protein [Anaeromyxobacteraceae bacterium]|nr:lecithin retinol acyltransferase family protein [Anaeromyxobacteraceae bacterium]
MAKGDHIVVSRDSKTYHGIDCGDGCVVEFMNGSAEEVTLPLRLVTLDRFADGNGYQTVRATDPADDVFVAWRALCGLNQPRLARFESCR